MIPTFAMRRLSTWLVGLFLIAQVFGVVSVLNTLHMLLQPSCGPLGLVQAPEISLRAAIITAMPMVSFSTTNCRI